LRGAILFMTFAMATGGTTILRESRNWTLQRIVTTPTPRWVFMGGKLAGIYTTGVIQMILLILATTLIARLMGREGSVWGTNIPGVALMILAVVFAATSLGLLIAALAQTPEQAATYNNVVIFLLGMLGGSFLPIEGLPAALKILPKFTLNFWGIDGFFDLAFDNAPISQISTNLLVLVAMGIVLFAVSLWRFSRRLDV
jgi:ABC-2 type transport system permease protein